MTLYFIALRVSFNSLQSQSSVFEPSLISLYGLVVLGSSLIFQMYLSPELLTVNSTESL